MSKRTQHTKSAPKMREMRSSLDIYYIFLVIDCLCKRKEFSHKSLSATVNSFTDFKWIKLSWIMTNFSICICNSSAVHPNHWTKNVKSLQIIKHRILSNWSQLDNTGFRLSIIEPSKEHYPSVKQGEVPKSGSNYNPTFLTPPHPESYWK